MSSPSPQGFDLSDAGWFLHDVEPQSGRAAFVRTDRAALSAEPFLDHRWRTEDAARAALPLAELQALAFEPPRLNFIWHTAFCASTLLSACLDAPGQCLALKEPRILLFLADLKRAGRLDRSGALAKAVFGLLARRFQPHEQILVKPSNGANTLVAEAAALTRGRMLLLHSDCETFLLSVAKRGGAGFTFARDLFRSFIAEGHPIGGWSSAQLLRLTDLELAALVWRMQMDALGAVSARLGHGARSLDCRLFLEDPGPVLRRLDVFFGLGLGHRQVEQVVDGPLFARDAKRPGQAYDPQAHEAERARLRAYLGADIAAVLQMLDESFPHPPALAPSLMADTPSWGASGDDDGARLCA